MAGLIAIVGRPNVGKSALFNRIVGRRIAIVHDEPGVTRDRVMAEAEWRGRGFTLVDTGGVGLVRGEKAPDVITAAAIEQVELAIEASSAIILVVNVQEGLTALDEEVAKRLRRSGKPILLAVNKVDTDRAEPGAAEFARLGLDAIFTVSAIHGGGIDDLVEAAVKHLPPEEENKTDSEKPVKLAIVGRPNVGKSSIINALTQSQRVIVSPIPGTTRDAVDVPFEVVTEGVRQPYVLIDTAGVRRERRIDNSVEFFSVKRTDESIDRADIVIMVLDAEVGIADQDKKICGKIVDARKPCIVVVNKWDLVKEEVSEVREKEIARRDAKVRGSKQQKSTLTEFGTWVQEHLFFLDYAPVIFTSAKSGFHLERLLEAVRYVTSQLKQQIPTSLLNRTINDAIERRQPVSAAGHRLKFFYATQVRLAPPTFLLFVNRDELFSDQYMKYLGDQLRKAFGYEGCPLVLVPKPRPKTIPVIRRDRPDTRRQAGAPRPVARPVKKHPARNRGPRDSRGRGGGR